MQLSRDHVRSLSVLTELMMTLTIKTQVSIYSPWGFALLRTQPPQNAALIGSLTSNPWTVKGACFPLTRDTWSGPIPWLNRTWYFDPCTMTSWPLHKQHRCLMEHLRGVRGGCDVTVQRSEGLVEHPICSDDASWLQIAFSLSSCYRFFRKHPVQVCGVADWKQ